MIRRPGQCSRRGVISIHVFIYHFCRLGSEVTLPITGRASPPTPPLTPLSLDHSLSPPFSRSHFIPFSDRPCRSLSSLPPHSPSSLPAPSLHACDVNVDPLSSAKRRGRIFFMSESTQPFAVDEGRRPVWREEQGGDRPTCSLLTVSTEWRLKNGRLVF